MRCYSKRENYNMDIGQDPNINKIIFKKYKLIKKIGQGTFGSIYEGINILTKEPVSVKLEDRTQNNILEFEGYTLYTLKGYGIIDLITFGRNKNYNMMVQPLLGDSLYQIFINLKKKFTLKDICLIGLQCLDRIEWVHEKNFIHCDIKPENFLMGKKDPRVIYMIDFGLSKKYRSERTKKHINFSITKKLVGTVRFASVNALKGYELSRRDDLESFCYMILFFILKKLPWQGIKCETQTKRYKKICEIKESFNIENYRKIIPMQIIEIYKYVKKLMFNEDPDYNKIRYLFKECLNKVNYKENETFSWIKDKKILNLKTIGYIQRRKSSSKKRIMDKLINNENQSKSNIKNKKDSLLINTSYSPDISCKYKSQLHSHHPSNEINNNSIYYSINPSITVNRNKRLKNNYLSEINIYKYKNNNNEKNRLIDRIQNDQNKNKIINNNYYHLKNIINNSGSKKKTKYIQKYSYNSFINPKNLTIPFKSKENDSINSYKDNYIKEYIPKFINEKFNNLTGSNGVSKSINLKHMSNNKLKKHYNLVKKRKNNYNDSYNPYQGVNINNTITIFKGIS